MSSIYNQMKAKIGPLVNNGPAYWCSIIGLSVGAILAAKISKEVGGSHSDILSVILLAYGVCLALLLTLVLFNLKPPPEELPVMVLLKRLFPCVLYTREVTRLKFNPLVRAKYVSPPPSTPYTPPRSRATV